MMVKRLELAIARLTGIQRRAVEWDDGALLVLAGPGSGKTEVLTCRIARLLDSSQDQHYRILALTFTNKAANEMSTRVAAFVPGLEERANIGTFHGFCAQALRQHGVHLGIKPDFAIFSQTADRKAVLEDALHRGRAQGTSHEDIGLLPWIDCLKARLVGPEQADRRMAVTNGATAEDASRVARTYRVYEDELRRVNALDLNSLIFEAYRLFGYPALARHYQTSYRYWLIDEFQDTNGAQYALLRRMAGQGFREVFAVADDDQTIFEWNGANVRRIGDLVKDFSCDVVQLPTNFRCPPVIVEAANRLVVYNARREPSKQPATPSESNSSRTENQPIQCRAFDTDDDEVVGIASEIASLDADTRSETAVLARNRALLEAMHTALKERCIPAEITMRRDDFSSAHMRWFVACLKQIERPLDRRNMTHVVESFNRFAGSPLDWDSLVSRSEADGIAFLSVWTDAVRETVAPSPAHELVDVIANLAAGGVTLTTAVEQVLSHFDGNNPDDDLKDDLNAWRRISREIKAARGFASLDRFLQELQLRSKEPVPAPGTVSLTTIHGAKGLAFDTVYLIGLAEGVLPSWHSVRKGDGSAAIEEERRGCFVAITRTKRRLILSRADRYRGYPKAPSRFLKEMGQLAGDGNGRVG